jgi:hypothetical protein
MTPKERAAKAIISRNLPYGIECRTDLWRQSLPDAEVALAAIAEPSEAMINGALRAWYGCEPHNRSHMRNLMRLTLKAAHAAMMAEKDDAK